MGISAEFQEHLASGLTTLARCWRVERKDGVVLGFTDHDCCLEFDGTAFQADSGMTAFALEQGTGLAVDNIETLGALSADHLERIDDAGIEAMATAGSVAVMLPGAMLYLRDTPPPVAALREAGVPMAVATDLNPGSSPVADPWTCATLACVTMGLTVEETLLGITARGADALGRRDLGRLRVGGPAEIVTVELPPGEPTSAAALVQFLGAGFGRVARW